MRLCRWHLYGRDNFLCWGLVISGLTWPSEVNNESVVNEIACPGSHYHILNWFVNEIAGSLHLSGSGSHFDILVNYFVGGSYIIISYSLTSHVTRSHNFRFKRWPSQVQQKCHLIRFRPTYEYSGNKLVVVCFHRNTLKPPWFNLNLL